MSLYPRTKETDLVGSGLGKVFFLDPVNGSDDSVYPYHPSKALATLAEAVDRCTDGAGDIIIRMPGTEQVTEAVTIDKSGITIMASTYGMNYSQPEKFVTYTAAAYTDGPVLEIEAPCALIGLEWETRNTAGQAIEINGEGGGFAGGFVLIKDCRFPLWYSKYAIEFSAGAFIKVENCNFDGAFTAAMNMVGSVSNNPTDITVEGCYFRGCAAGILHGTTVHRFLYKGNIFADCTAAITFSTHAATGNGLVCSNILDAANHAGAFDRDLTQLAAQNIYCMDNHYREA